MQLIGLAEPVRRAATLLGVVSSVRPLTGPSSVSLEVSAKCNYSCLMCPYHSPVASKPSRAKQDFMDLALAERLFKDLGRIGTQIVNFGHRGEPTLHPDFPTIVRFARREGLQTRLFTNGSLLTRRRLEEIVDAGLTSLTVSLVSPSADAYVRIHPGTSSGTLQRILDSLSLLQELKKDKELKQPRLELRFIAIDGCLAEIDNMVDLGIELRANKIHLVPLMYREGVDVAALDPTREEERLAVERLKALAPKAARAGLQINLEEMSAYHLYGPRSHTLPCYAPWVEISVLADGTVTFCVRCHRAMGSIMERSLEDIWFDPKYTALRRMAANPGQRHLIGEMDCNRCCLLYTNWRITRRLASFGLAPKMEY